MKAKLIFLGLTAISLCQFQFAYASYAGYGDQSGQGPSIPVPPVWNQPAQPANPNDGFQIKLSGPTGSVVFGQDGSRFEERRRHHGRRDDIRWINMAPGFPIPPSAVQGGSENYQPLYVCHAVYNNGVHPGKVVAGNCNISFGGREIPMSRYQVLISRSPLGWEAATNGSIPANAIPGGFENGRPLFICQTQYAGGTHPGKLVGGNCNIAYGGREISVPYYNVLVR